MPRDLPPPAAPKAEPELAENKAMLRPRGKKGKGERFRDLPERPGKLTEAAIERGVKHLRVDNPEIWNGSICDGDD